MSTLLRVFLCLFCLQISPVFADVSEAACPRPPELNTPDNWRWLKVEVIYLEQEGGFYGLQTADGERFFPMQLDSLYQQAGLQIRVLIEIMPQYKSFRIWGTPVQIHYILPSCL